MSTLIYFRFLLPVRACVYVYGVLDIIRHKHQTKDQIISIKTKAKTNIKTKNPIEYISNLVSNRVVQKKKTKKKEIEALTT